MFVIFREKNIIFVNGLVYLTMKNVTRLLLYPENTLNTAALSRAMNYPSDHPNPAG